MYIFLRATNSFIQFLNVVLKVICKLYIAMLFTFNHNSLNIKYRARHDHCKQMYNNYLQSSHALQTLSLILLYHRTKRPTITTLTSPTPATLASSTRAEILHAPARLTARGAALLLHALV